MAGRVGVKALKDFFGYRPNEGLREFAAEVKALTDEDFEQLRQGIEDETLTY
jgi:hypothetical protein